MTTEEVEFVSDPTTFQEAWNHPDPVESERWRDVIKKEFNDMMKSQSQSGATYRRTIGSKWVFKRKRYVRFRARLCGLGYTQIAGIDFTANYAPVVNDFTFRILLLLKILLEWDAGLIDIELAFLHGDMEELIYMNLPEGLNLIEGVEENEDYDYVLLDKNIYGTVQAAWQWAKMFKKTIYRLSFEANLIDPCLMTRTNDEGVVILCIYADDVLLVEDKEAIKSTVEDIKIKFDIRKEGPLTDYLGCIIKFMNKESSIHQPHPLKKLENKFLSLTKGPCNHKLP